MDKYHVVQHFKNKEYYLVLFISKHTETGEELVNYRALYPPYDYYSRPIEMFYSKVDELKYPEYAGKDRFSLVNTIPNHIVKLLNQWYGNDD